MLPLPDAVLLRSIPRPPPFLQVATVKTIIVEPTRGRAIAGAQAGSGAGGGAAPKGQAGPGASSGAPPQTDVARVSASPFSSLGGLGSGVTVVGSGGGGLSLALPTVGSGFGGAKERAAAAARRVPSPEPQPRKEKGKKVSWQKDDAMVGVRWFRKVGPSTVRPTRHFSLNFMWRSSTAKSMLERSCALSARLQNIASCSQDDPPSAAQRDATVDGPVGAAAAAARAASPPKFESAAKKEHLSEAAALRQHRAEVGPPAMCQLRIPVPSAMLFYASALSRFNVQRGWSVVLTLSVSRHSQHRNA
jgi:hypothetical protein